MESVIQSRTILVALLTTIGILLIGNVLGVFSTFVLGHDSVFGLVELFRFDHEKNLPTLFSSIQLIIASLLLAVIGRKHFLKREPYVSWYGLCIIFFFLSVDETAQFHEQLNSPMRDSLSLGGFFYFAWVIPYGSAVLVFLLVYVKFLRSLPRRTLALFLLAGTMFLTGAIGFEMLSAAIYESENDASPIYAMFYTLEELLEMVGIAIFIYALLSYYVAQFGDLRLVLRSDART